MVCSISQGFKTLTGWFGILLTFRKFKTFGELEQQSPDAQFIVYLLCYKKADTT